MACSYGIVKEIAKQDINSFANIWRSSAKVCLTYFTDSSDLSAYFTILGLIYGTAYRRLKPVNRFSLFERSKVFCLLFKRDFSLEIDNSFICSYLFAYHKSR